MPFLIIEHRGLRRAGALNGRVLIGRWPNMAIAIADRAISRIHAWIGLQGGRYYVADAGSRTGTFVNGRPLRDRHFLVEGDEMRVGPAVLHYHAGVDAPADLETIDLSPRPVEGISGARGVFKDCECGAPLWLPAEFSGVGQCRYCGQRVQGNSARSAEPPEMPTPPPLPDIPAKPVVTSVTEKVDDVSDELLDDALLVDAGLTPPAPSASAGAVSQSTSRPTMKPLSAPRTPAKSELTFRVPIPAAPLIPPAPARPPTAPKPASKPPEPARECGVCHSSITRFDETAACPSCGLVFHHDCWHENRGCSAYGCAQVGALAPQKRPA